jgi:hypothetical protein
MGEAVLGGRIQASEPSDLTEDFGTGGHQE